MGLISDPAAVYGAAVCDVYGRPLGVAEQVYLDRESGWPTWALVGGPGLGGHRLVPLDHATLVVTGVQVPYTAADLAGAPVRDPRQELSPADEQELHRHYAGPPRSDQVPGYPGAPEMAQPPSIVGTTGRAADAPLASATTRNQAGATAATVQAEAGVTAQTARAEAGVTAQTARAEVVATAQTARAELQQVASTASSAAAEVVGATKEQVGTVAGEALDQVHDLTDQLREQVSQQVGTASARLSQAVRSLAEELHEMGSNTGERSGAGSQAALSLAARGHRLADYLDGNDPETMLADARVSAAHRPGRFLLGAVLAGVVCGRVARGAKTAKNSGLVTASQATPVVASTVAAAEPPVPLR